MVRSGPLALAGVVGSGHDSKRSYTKMEIKRVPIDRLDPSAYNPRKDLQPGDPAYDKLVRSMDKFGYIEPIVWNQRTGHVVGGHQRLKILIAAGETEADVSVVDLSLTDEKTLNIALNKVGGEWDDDKLSALLEELAQDIDADETLTGFDVQEIGDLLDAVPYDTDWHHGKQASGKKRDAVEPNDRRDEARLTLNERFLVAPFSILDARSGFWMERKRAWKSIGIRSEIGRGADGDKTKQGLTYGTSAQPGSVYQFKNQQEELLGRKLSWDEFASMYPEKMAQGGTSIFDPVLCEIAYRWFCPPGGAVIDPFAGGSVRGAVAALTGRRYTGVDLSARQIEANNANWEEIAAGIDGDVHAPNWINGDSLHIDELAPGKYDLLFTCPPYADLEVYSDQPEDLSNKPYPEFINLYREIIKKSVAMLKQNRFACVVVGDIRDSKGIYRGFVNDTIDAFRDAGMSYYNEGILITPFGSLVIRVGKQFTNSRKLGKTHQNVLVFVKGDPVKATQAIGPVEFDTDFLDGIEPADDFDEEAGA